jgi:hypothetical protein
VIIKLVKKEVNQISSVLIMHYEKNDLNRFQF